MAPTGNLLSRLTEDVGISLRDIRKLSPSELKKYIEKKSKKLLSLNNALIDLKMVDKEDLDKDIDKLIGCVGK
jgi:hypothetical protein